MLDKNACNNFIEHLNSHSAFNQKDMTLLLSSEYIDYEIKKSLLSVNPKLSIDQLSIENCDYEYIKRFINKNSIAVLFINHISSFEAMEKNKLLADKIDPLIRDFSEKAVGFTDINDMFNDVFSTSLQRLKHLNKTFINLCNSANLMKIYSANGTHLSVVTKTCKKWVSILGFGDSDDHTPSEVATYTKDISGEFFFRGMFLCKIPFSLKYGFIDEPFIFEIKSGRINSVKCVNKSLEQDINHYLSSHDDHRNITEIGFGTNEGLSYLPEVSASFIERYPGLHLGLGGSVRGSIHMDLISCDSIIKLDETTIFNKKFLI